MGFDGYLRIAKHAGLRESGALLDALVSLDGDPDTIADALRAHHLIRLLQSELPEGVLRARLPGALQTAIASRRPVGRMPPATLLGAFAEVRQALAEAGVPVLVLKGFPLAARLYGGLDRRPQHDVDLLVRRRDYRSALRRLARLGFARRKRDLHSRSVERDGVQIDVHRHLRWAPAWRVREDDLWRAAVEVRIEGVQVPTLSDEHTLLLLTLAAFEDLGQGQAKLKQLLDAYLLLRATDGTIDWERFFTLRGEENLLAVSVNVLALVVELFQARGELAHLPAALDRRRDLCVLSRREELLELVAAPAKHRANLVWFGRVYPGSLVHYLLWFWYGGLPGNLGRLRPGWLGAQLAVTAEVSRRRHRRPVAS
jgi:hypothetical protein